MRDNIGLVTGKKEIMEFFGVEETQVPPPTPTGYPGTLLAVTGTRIPFKGTQHTAK